MDNPPISVTIETDSQSGSAVVRVTLAFGAASLDEALAMIKRATNGAPIFNAPEEGNR